MWKKHTYKNILSLPTLVRLLLFLLLVIGSITSSAQNKKKKKITIEDADILLYDELIVKKAQRLLGNVILSHKNMILTCDSAWAYSNSNTVDAFGRVHILSNDTLDMWADYINYNGDSGLAKARKNVKLKDPSLTLTTDSLDYNMNDEIGYYNYGGKIVDSTNTLTSLIGVYYTKKNELFFTVDVLLVNEDYTMTADTMIYNTQTEIVSFEGPTDIIGDSTSIFSTLGWFNTKTKETELNRNSTIRRGNTQLQGDYIYYNDETKKGFAKKNVIINDFENNMIVSGHNAVYDDFDRYALVTDSAVWIQYSQGDSLFLHADTLYTIPDTTSIDGKMLITYNHVRFYRTDIQGIADSLVYFTKDSVIQMYNDPVIWSSENQMTADFIEFNNNATPPNEVYLNNNAFIIQQNDSTKFNQIKGKNMVGLIDGTVLYRIDVNGNGQSIYYPADGKEYIGINKAESSNIILYLSENQIKRITFVGSPVGTMKPILEKVSPDSMLDGFKWRDDERPINRYDIFENYNNSENPLSLPNSEIENPLPSLEEMNIEVIPEDEAIQEK